MFIWKPFSEYKVNNISFFFHIGRYILLAFSLTCIMATFVLIIMVYYYRKLKVIITFMTIYYWTHCITWICILLSYCTYIKYNLIHFIFYMFAFYYLGFPTRQSCIFMSNPNGLYHYVFGGNIVVLNCIYTGCPITERQSSLNRLYHCFNIWKPRQNLKKQTNT